MTPDGVTQKIRDAAAALDIRTKISIVFECEDTEDETLASVAPNPYGTEWDFRVYPAFYLRDDPDEIIAHELAHVLLFPLSGASARLIGNLVKSLRKSKTRDALEATVTDELQHQEDVICEILAPILAKVVAK